MTKHSAIIKMNSDFLISPPSKDHNDYKHYLNSIAEVANNYHDYIQDLTVHSTAQANEEKTIFCQELIEISHSASNTGEIIKRLLTNNTITLEQLGNAIDHILLNPTTDTLSKIDDVVSRLSHKAQCHLILYSQFNPADQDLNLEIISLLAQQLQQAEIATAKKIVTKIKNKISLNQLLTTSANPLLWLFSQQFYKTKQGKAILSELFIRQQSIDLFKKNACFIEILPPNILYQGLTTENPVITLSELNLAVKETLFLYYCQNNLSHAKFKHFLERIDQNRQKFLVNKIYTSEQALYTAVVTNYSAIPLSILTAEQREAIFCFYLTQYQVHSNLPNPIITLNKTDQKAIHSKILITHPEHFVIHNLVCSQAHDAEALINLLHISSKHNYPYQLNFAIFDYIVAQGMASNKVAYAGNETPLLLAEMERHGIITANAYFFLPPAQRTLWLTTKANKPDLQNYVFFSCFHKITLDFAILNNKGITEYPAKVMQYNLNLLIKDLMLQAPKMLYAMANVFYMSELGKMRGLTLINDYDFVTQAFALALKDPGFSLADAIAFIDTLAKAYQKHPLLNAEGNAKVLVDIMAKMITPTSVNSIIENRIMIIIFELEERIKKEVIKELSRKEMDIPSKNMLSALFASQNVSLRLKAQLLLKLHSYHILNPSSLDASLGQLKHPATQLAHMLKMAELQNNPKLIQAIFMYYINQNPTCPFEKFVDLTEFTTTLPRNKNQNYQLLATLWQTVLDPLLPSEDFDKVCECLLNLAHSNPIFFNKIYKKLSHGIKTKISHQIAHASVEKLARLQQNITALDITALLIADEHRLILLSHCITAIEKDPTITKILSHLMLAIFNILSPKIQRDICANHHDSLSYLLIQTNVPIKSLYHYYPANVLVAMVDSYCMTKDFNLCHSLLAEGLYNTKQEKERYAEILNRTIDKYHNDTPTLYKLVREVSILSNYLSNKHWQQLCKQNIMDKPVYQFRL